MASLKIITKMPSIHIFVILQSLLSIPVLWTAPLLLICVTYTLYAEIGAVALIGIILTIGQMPLQLLLARLLTNLRLVNFDYRDPSY